MSDADQGQPPPKSPSSIVVGRKQYEIILQIAQRWLDSGVIDSNTAEVLRNSVKVSAFDWRRTARYAFLISICCLVIAIGAILADEALLRIVRRLFNAPALLKCGLLTVVSAAFFRLAVTRRVRAPYRIYRNEAIFFLGVLALAWAVVFLGLAVDSGTKHFSLLILLASVLYLLLGLWFPSKQVWVFGLLSLGGWMGAETGYASGYGMYFLGMNYPIRFAVIGSVLALAGLVSEQLSKWKVVSSPYVEIVGRLHLVSAQTKVIGLLFTFIALWILSIFGNYGDMAAWQKIPQSALFYWSALFGVAALGALGTGLRRDDAILRGFGLTFLFLNLYTRYFEYFWKSTHKAVFFAILAASFWFLGSKAESIWYFGTGRKSAPRSG